MKNFYPIEIHHVDEGDDGNGYFFVFNPDFGHSACSATGDSIPEAITLLGIIRREVIAHYKETGKNIPVPTLPEFLHGGL